jgi:TetR/AcrR family transcriptional regulator of autoinduction and epiphytic fitness
MASVKTSPSSRAERARRTRRRMLNSARKLFVSRGYPDTTMTQIADRADVAVQTLYYTFQTKGKLLIEILEVASAGGDPVPVPQRKWFQEMMSSPNAQRILALGVEHGTAIYERVAELWPAVATAVSDPYVADYWEGVGTRRRDAQRGQVTRISELGSLKPGLTIERATDLIFLLNGHPPYRSLVQDAGWPIVEYKAWLFTTLVQQLLDTASVDPRAVADLSFANPGTTESPK